MRAPRRSSHSDLVNAVKPTEARAITHAAVVATLWISLFFLPMFQSKNSFWLRGIGEHVVRQCQRCNNTRRLCPAAASCVCPPACAQLKYFVKNSVPSLSCCRRGIEFLSTNHRDDFDNRMAVTTSLRRDTRIWCPHAVAGEDGNSSCRVFNCLFIKKRKKSDADEMLSPLPGAEVYTSAIVMKSDGERQLKVTFQAPWLSPLSKFQLKPFWRRRNGSDLIVAVASLRKVLGTQCTMWMAPTEPFEAGAGLCLR